MVPLPQLAAVVHIVGGRRFASSRAGRAHLWITLVGVLVLIVNLFIYAWIVRRRLEPLASRSGFHW